MRIGFLANISAHFATSWPGVLTAIEQEGHQVYLAAGDAGNIEGKWEVNKLDGVTRKPSFYSVKALRSIRSWVSANRIDVVVTNTATPSALSRIALLGRTPVVYFAHGLHWGANDGVSSIPWKLVEYSLSFASVGVVVLNSEDEAFFRMHRRKLPVLRLPYGLGVDSKLYPRAAVPMSYGGGRLRLLWVGEFIDRKRPIDALLAMEWIRSKGYDAHLTMCGNGPLLSNVRAEIAQRGLSEYVAMPGVVPILNFYSDSDVLIHTARWEGLPRVFLEALSVGLPVCSYPIKGSNGINGVRVSATESPAHLAETVLEALERDIVENLPVPMELDSASAGRPLAVFVAECASRACLP